MKLWTVQPKAALDALAQTGVFRCQREKSYNLTKPGSLEKPYQWMMEQMRRRIGPPPARVEYPVWAWHTWEFARRAPDVDSAAFLRRTEEKALLTLDVPEDRALLSDFDAWQMALQGFYVAGDLPDAEYDALLERLESLTEAELRRETENSWVRVFDVSPVKREGFARGKFIQATLWEIRRECLIDARLLPPNA